MADGRDAMTGASSGATFDPSTQPQRPDLSLGELLAEMTSEFGNLLRAELDLAKTELKEEAGRAGRAAGMFAAASGAALVALSFLSAALAWLLDQGINRSLSFALVGLLWVIVALVLLTRGKNKAKGLDVLPVTKDTLREDVQWARAHRS